MLRVGVDLNAGGVGGSLATGGPTGNIQPEPLGRSESLINQKKKTSQVFLITAEFIFKES